MPIFRGKKVKKCPRGYVEDRKTKQCVPIDKFKLKVGGGGYGLGFGGGSGDDPFGPIIPIIPVTPVNPDNPDNPDNILSGGDGLTTGQIVGITLGSAVAIATLSEVIRRYYADTPNTRLNRRLARDDAMDFIERENLTAEQLEDAGYVLEEYGNGDQELVPLNNRTLVQRGSGTRRTVNVDTVPDSQGAIRDPQDMIADEERLEQFFQEQRELREGEGGIELSDATAIDILPAVDDVVPDDPGIQMPKTETSVTEDFIQAGKTMLEDIQERTSILTPQKLAEFVRNFDIQGKVQRFYGSGGSGRNRRTEPKREQSDLFADNVIDEQTEGEFVGSRVFDDDDEEPLLRRRRRRQAGSGAAETDPLFEEGGAPAGEIDDAELDEDADPYEQVINEEAKVENPVFDDDAIVRDNLIDVKPNEFSNTLGEDVLIQSDSVEGVIEQLAVESGLEPELIAIPTTSVTDMVVSGLTNNIVEAGSGVVEGIGGLVADVVSNVGVDIIAGLGYASGVVAEGSSFVLAAASGEIGIDALIGAMAGGIGGMMAGMYTAMLGAALPIGMFLAVTMTLDTIFDTNFSGFNPDTPPVPRSLELKYTFNKIFESLGIPLVLLGDKYISDGEFGYFEYKGEIYPTSDLKTLLPEAFKNNPNMRKNINFTIEMIYEKSMFKYNQTELQEEFGLDPTTVGEMTFDEIIAMSRPLRKRLVAEISTRLIDLQNQFNDFKKKYDEDNYTSFEDQMDFIKHKVKQERGGFGIKSNILNGGTGVIATAFGGDVNKLNQVLNRMHYMEEATYGVNGLEVERPYLKPAELVVQGYIDQLIATAKTPDFDTLTPQEQAIVGQPLNIEGLGEGANAIARPDEVVTPVPDSELSKIEPTYGYQPGDPLPEGVTQDNYIIQQGGQPFQFAPESELNPIQSTPSQTTVPVEA